MILHYKITFDELSKVGKNYKWPINFCECCNRNMWGHGYVARYFAVLLDSVFLKRYRCPGCRTVVVIRPEGYWPWLRSSILMIHEALMLKLSSGRWPTNCTRQRGGHWLKRFVQFAQMEMKADLCEFLNHCYHKQIPFLP